MVLPRMVTDANVLSFIPCIAFNLTALHCGSDIELVVVFEP